jgi:hypothetical protein
LHVRSARSVMPREDLAISTREVLKEALESFDDVELRADNHDSPSELFEDTRLLGRLRGPNWQPLYGLPGSGKTIHLRTLYDRFVDDYRGTPTMPVYINLRDCISDARRVEDPREQALEYYWEFLDCLPRLLRDSCRALRHNGVWLSFFQEVVPNGGDDQRAIRKLRRIVREFRGVRSYSDVVFAESSASEADRERGVAVDGVASSSSVAKAKANWGRAKRTRNRMEVQAKGEIRRVIGHQQIRDVFQELTEARDVKRIALLIDEWSSLDPTGQTDIQPAFGELLRATFRSSPHVTIKLATNPRQTRLYNDQTGEGLRPRDDLFHPVHLDGAVLPDNKVIAFFSGLLQKHLQAVHDSLKDELARRRLLGPKAPDVVGALFATRGAFKALIYGTGGSPRQFLYTVRTLIDRSEASLDRRWTVEDVYEALGLEADEFAVGPPAAVLEDEVRTAADVLLDQAILPVVVRNRARLFLVAVGDIRDVGSLLSQLEARGDISRATRFSRSRTVRERYVAYAVSSEIWKQVERYVRFKHRRVEADHAAVDTVAEAAHFVIDKSALMQGGWIERPG